MDYKFRIIDAFDKDGNYVYRFIYNKSTSVIVQECYKENVNITKEEISFIMKSHDRYFIKRVKDALAQHPLKYHKYSQEHKLYITNNTSKEINKFDGEITYISPLKNGSPHSKSGGNFRMSTYERRAKEDET